MTRAAVSPSLPTKFANLPNIPAAPRKILPRSLKRFRRRQTKPSSSWKKALEKWKSAQVSPIKPVKRSKQFRASFASRLNSFRKFRSLQNNRFAERKASPTRCRSSRTSLAQTTQGARQTASTVGNMVRLSEQLNEALAQFRSQSARPVKASGRGSSRMRR